MLIAERGDITSSIRKGTMLIIVNNSKILKKILIFLVYWENYL